MKKKILCFLLLPFALMSVNAQNENEVLDQAKAVTDALQKKVERLKELFVNGLISIDEYKADKEKYTEKITELRKCNETPAEDVLRAVEGLRRINGQSLKVIYADLTAAEKRRFWRGLIGCISFGADRSINVDFLPARY